MTADTGSLTMTTLTGHDAYAHAGTAVPGHVTTVGMSTGHVRGGHVTGQPLVTCPGTVVTDTATVTATRDHDHVTSSMGTAVMVTAERMPMTNAVDGSGDPR